LAKKRNEALTEEQQRLSRKEILRARKQERQLRTIRLSALVVIVLIGVVLVIALINEYFIVPNQVVASVGEQEIALSEWQERVRYERAQRIIFLENQLEAFGGDVGIVQQFGGQAINDLFDPEGMGQNVVNTMADELVICQGLEDRGVIITDADVDAEIERNFNFFGGESPTPQPTSTETPVPTPSITPLPTQVITDVVPTATLSPTATIDPAATITPSPPPPPTATPVSQESFDEQYAEFIAQFNDLGIDETVYRSVVRTQLCRERLSEILAEEEGLSGSAEQASVFLLTFESEEEAAEAVAQIEESDFLTVWNTIRSRPPEDVAAEGSEGTEEPASTATAGELPWRTRETLEGSHGAEVAEAAFSLPTNEPSEVISVTQPDTESQQYVILMVSGREERPLSESELNTRKQEILQLFVDEQLAERLQIQDTWRNRVPTVPVLDSKFLVPPTPAPTTPPTVPVPLEETPAAEATEAPAEATAEPADNGE
jgi:hypothetical protein